MTGRRWGRIRTVAMTTHPGYLAEGFTCSRCGRACLHLFYPPRSACGLCPACAEGGTPS